AELLKTIAEAVAYAHSRGILHRDIKPSNILVDQSGQPRITDFGLAKRFGVPASAGGAAGGLGALPPEGGTPNDLTLSGQLLGTPNYAPPEQLAVRRGALGPHSDVYALGAVLYEMLTGRPPFLAATIEATLLQVIDAEPVSPRLLNPSVPIDLETICLKCLEKEPARRYLTAQALAEELSRFLHGRTILARPLGVVGQLWRWCRRKPGWATAGALTHLLVVAVVLVTLVARNRLAEQAEVVRQNSYVADMHLVAQAIEANNLGHATELLDKWWPTPHSALRTPQSEDDLRGFEWFYFNRLCQSDELLTVGSHSNVVTSLAFSPDGRLLASGSFDGEVRVWALSLGDPERGIHSISPGSTGDGRNKFRAPSRLLGVVRHASRINALAFSSD
ncbi:MAG: protein kinase, partial [Pedosphaera parvula]|nr:protein kinase [Pedosphaera parvula]